MNFVLLANNEIDFLKYNFSEIPNLEITDLAELVNLSTMFGTIDFF